MRTRERRAELRRLEAEAAELSAAWKAAREAAARPWETAEAGRELCDYFADVAYTRRLADPQEEARLVEELMNAIRSQGIVLMPVDFRNPASGFHLHDPALDAAVRDTEAKLHATKARLATAHAAHDAALEDDERKRAVHEFRESLTSDDPEKVAAAFEAVRRFERPEVREDAMTTADLEVVR